VLTVGTFDGVHRGHAQLIARVLLAARTRGTAAVLVTFDPHPLSVVRPAAAPPILSTPAEKIEVLAASGLDAVAVLRFDRALAQFSPREFVQEKLLPLGMGHLVVGYDHAFGRNRSGDVATLQALGRELRFTVEVVEPVEGEDGPISSTRIRAALGAGDVATAAAALGRAYTLRGTVVRGDGRGRALGFPTANLRTPPGKLVPLEGIYAVRVFAGHDGHDGVLHVGPRPTFGDPTPTIEVHIFDFDGDLYGSDVRVDFCERIRGLEAFDGERALVRAMEEDAAAARRVLRGGGGACGIPPEPLA
jgi:riboflavin kinase/FMN adenylyltransferase